MKLLVLAIDGTGMGHLSRTLTLARALRQTEPDSEVRFLVESPAWPMIASAGFDVVKLPDPRHPLGRHAIRGLRTDFERNAVEHAVHAQQPRAMLLDFILDPGMFDTLHRKGCKVIEVLRRQRPRVMRQLPKDPASRLVDTWLVPHEETEFAPGEIPEELRPRCRFIGPVVRPLDPEKIPALRKRYAKDASKLVLVALGGGGSPEGRQFARLTLEAIRRLQELHDDMVCVAVWGPLNPEPLPQKERGIEVVRFEVNMPELMAAADVVVANAGYNTLREISVSGTPAVVVPLRTTGRDDQEARAKKVGRAGRARVCEADSRQIGEHIEALLSGKSPAKLPAKVLGDLSRAGQALSLAMRS